MHPTSPCPYVPIPCCFTVPCINLSNAAHTALEIAILASASCSPDACWLLQFAALQRMHHTRPGSSAASRFYAMLTPRSPLQLQSTCTPSTALPTTPLLFSPLFFLRSLACGLFHGTAKYRLADHTPAIDSTAATIIIAAGEARSDV